MKLFQGGYGKYKYFTVAKDSDEAAANIKEKYNLQALPVKAEPIDNIEGYEIIALEEGYEVVKIEVQEEEKQQQLPIEEKPKKKAGDK